MDGGDGGNQNVVLLTKDNMPFGWKNLLTNGQHAKWMEDSSVGRKDHVFENWWKCVRNKPCAFKNWLKIILIKNQNYLISCDLGEVAQKVVDMCSNS